MTWLRILILSQAAAFCVHATAIAQPAKETLEEARQALQMGNVKEALRLAHEAVARDADKTRALHFRATLFTRLGEHEKAAADLSQMIKIAPDAADYYNLRGGEYFKLGKFAESVKDFDKYIELKPERKADHWQRGISLYYAGQYEEGRRQFERYQTVDSGDVENAVWRFMCMAKSVGLKEARRDMLKVDEDRRIPMKEVYNLFAGKLQPDAVMAAARANEPAAEKLKQQLFYAHLYVGIFHDLEGRAEEALLHLNKAVNDYRIGHYMWDVARVHADRLRLRK